MAAFFSITFGAGQPPTNFGIPQVVPLQPVPSQEVNVTLNNQPCTIKVYTKHIQVPTQPPGSIITEPPVYQPIDPIFLDLYVNDILVIGGVLCHDSNAIVRDAYLGFSGELTITDMVAEDDPQVSGLGTRWLLLYWPLSS